MTAPTQARFAPTRPPPDLGPALALARRLVASARQLAVSLDASAPFFIDLPPDAAGPDDQARLQSAATLYLAADLEAAGLLPAAESLAELAATGGIQADFGLAASQLATFWRGRHTRFAPAERLAFYAQLFGRTDGAPLASEHGVNDQFEPAMIDLTDAIGQAGTGPAADVRVRAAARELSNNLLPRSGGVALAAAGDLLTSIQQALDLLKHPAVQQATGSRGLWDVVRYVARRLHGGSPDPQTHVARGKAGMAVIAWLAGVLPRAGFGSLVAPGDPVVDAAVEWLQASLALHEADAPAGRRGA